MIPTANRLTQVTEYYFATKLREIRERNERGENVLNLGIGNPDLPPHESVLHRLIDSATEPGHHGYQPYKGIPELRAAMADWYSRIYGVSLDAQTQLQPLMGSKEGVMHISMAFLNPGDEVLAPDPGYLTYGAVARLIGAETQTYNLSEENGWQPDLEALSRRDLSRVKLMWVNYPHMPSGAVAGPGLFERLVAFGREHNILIVNDNPYSLILNRLPQSILSAPGAFEVALELNSLSKSHNLAGWRVGMVAGAAPYVQAVLQVKSNMDSGMWLPVQQAAATALSMEYSWHESLNATYAARREAAWRILETLGCTFEREQAGLFIWARIPESAASGEALSEALLDQARVFLTPGFVFGKNGDRYLRLSLCSSLTTLESALQRVQAFVRDQQPANAFN